MKTRTFRLRNVITIILILLVTQTCKKDENNLQLPEIEKVIEMDIDASIGGTLTTSDSVKLIIPSGALPSDGKVLVGRTGNEPTTVPNSNLEIIGKAITIQLPTDTILKPLQLSFPASSNNISTDINCIFLYNGTDYIPLEYSIDDSQINITIDLINWGKDSKKNTLLFSEIYILWLINEQTPPEIEIGINKVSMESGEMVFSNPSATSTSKVLLFLHGWMGRATTWEQMLTWFQEETDQSYSEYWTFGYNSSRSINSNAKDLADLIKKNANDAQIDIVAHSMGGLVSRSMIEQNSGDVYINKLITLGTPHHGSNLAALRNYLGLLVATDNIANYVIYNYISQGFKNLYTNSSYITDMMKIEKPPLPYYLIAATSTPQWNFFINGDDDGVVGVLSALGVPGAITPTSTFSMPNKEAHTKMPNYTPIYEQVVTYLKDGNQFDDYAITTLRYEDNSNWEQIIDDLFDSNYRVADWTDLESFYSNGGDLLALYDGLGLTEYGNAAFVTRNGDHTYSSTRYYFASRHEHNKPGTYLAHDNIDNYLISLGSWYGSRQIIVIKK